MIESAPHLNDCQIRSTCQQLEEDNYCFLILSLHSALDIPDLEVRERFLKDLKSSDGLNKCPLYQRLQTTRLLDVEELTLEAVYQVANYSFVRETLQIV